MLLLFVDHHNLRHYHSPAPPPPTHLLSSCCPRAYGADVVSILKEIILAKKERQEMKPERKIE
jgi:hypothetical protein